MLRYEAMGSRAWIHELQPASDGAAAERPRFNGRTATVEQLKKRLAEIGLDTTKFDFCDPPPARKQALPPVRWPEARAAGPRTRVEADAEIAELRRHLETLRENERRFRASGTPTAKTAAAATRRERLAVTAVIARLGGRPRSYNRTLDRRLAQRHDASLAGATGDLAVLLRQHWPAVPAHEVACHVLRFPDVYGTNLADRRLARARLVHALRDRSARELLVAKDDMDDDLSRFEEGGGPVRAAELIIGRMAGCSSSTVQRARAALGHKKR
jgi:hypothetical protein